LAKRPAEGIGFRSHGPIANGPVAAGALAAGTLRSTQAADATTFVSGFGLQVNLDPHQIFDVPMQAMMLNAYDNLYRYQGDPPKIVP
jgi:peptide/nickel transport system substrate-binding protein